MLLIETYLDLSPGKGLGLFAKCDIVKGTRFWLRSEVFDKVITPDDMNSLNELALEYVKRFGCLEKTNNWYLCADNARFSNHADNPNSKNEFDENGLIKYHVASRDIKAGEEIFCDYKELCQTCKNGISFSESFIGPAL